MPVSVTDSRWLTSKVAMHDYACNGSDFIPCCGVLAILPFFLSWSMMTILRNLVGPNKTLPVACEGFVCFIRLRVS